MGHLAVGFVVVGVGCVPVVGAPTSGEDLHKANPTLHQPSSQKAVSSKMLGYRIVQTVHFLNGLAFQAQVHRFGNGALHAERQLIGGDAGIEVVDI